MAYNLYISQTVETGDIVEEEAFNTITAVNTIENGAYAYYHADNAVFLNPGFTAEAGSIFYANILGCIYSPPQMSQSTSKTKMAATDVDSIFENELKKEYVVISPNPSSSTVDISLDDFKMSHIVVTSMDGRVMIDKNLKDASSHKLDISNYTTGIYMVSATTANGKVFTGKIIKK